MSELKAVAMRAIESLPENVDLERILAEIIFQAKVLQGIKDVSEGRTKPIEQVRNELLGLR